MDGDNYPGPAMDGASSPGQAKDRASSPGPTNDGVSPRSPAGVKTLSQTQQMMGFLTLLSPRSQLPCMGKFVGNNTEF